MATDSTNLPQGEATLDAGMTGSDLDHTMVQEAAATEPTNFVDLPKGNTVILLPVQPGQTVRLPTDSTDGVLAKIGPEGNLALVVDGRTIILQGFLKANDQSPVKLVTNDGDDVNVADLIAATDPSLDIQTAAGPASGDTGDGEGSGIYIPFLVGPGLGGILAEGILDPTALQYRLIDDDFKLFTEEEDTGPSNIDITFDILGGIVNEDDLPADQQNPDFQLALVVKDQGNDGTGNDPFDTKDREPGSANNPPDDADDVDDVGGVDPDREPLVTVATVKVNFGPDVPGTLWLDDTKLPDGLKSEGEEITYQVLPPNGGQGNGIVGFVDGNGNGKFDDEFTDRLVFDIKIQEDSSNSVFHVNFTLYDNIDNTPPDADKDGAADLLGGNEQILDLPVKVTAKDSDGSTLSTIMHLGVEDDVPFFGEVHVAKGEGGIEVTIDQRDADITHDETKGVDGDADDQSYWDAQPWADAAKQKVTDAGFGLPYGDSEGALWPKGIAQTQVMASFGADQATQEYYKDPSGAARNSVFGELEDISDRDGDGLNDGENERPFELFMTVGTGAPGAVETHFKNPGDTSLQTAHLSIADQETNTSVTWNGQQLKVYLHQVDAQTIIGYVIPPEGDENSPQARLVDIDGENGEAVFVLTIDDQGVMTFVQYHQLNHPDAGDGSNGTHDEPFQILAADGSPLINVRISDYDGDHAQQPVNLVVQDDGPKFCGVDWGCDNDSKNGKGLIDEDKLDPNGNHDWAPGDDKGGKHADGKINFDFGVDKPGHVEAQALTVKDSANQTLLAVTFSYDEDEFGNRAYTVDGDSDLKTADGHPIEIEASFDSSTGVLTLIGRDTVDDSEAFTYTLQTTGYDKGEFSFCLNEALYHPYTDSDSENDGPEKSFEDNLKFDLTVRGYDVDGDWADGSVCINVDDDSPKAECDFECVVEGTHGEGELNFATGNVVTGNGDTVFGNDANNLDGNADSPGADQPYTISKLAHGGNEYVLVANGDGTYHVEKGGVALPETGDESFDGKILHIPTQEGGTLDIVLVSDVQSEVGDYKYTVPENAQHDHDIHVGPEDSLTESVSGAFDTVSEWTTSFANGGITIVPLNGSLNLKNIDVAGGGSPDYRGIGVENFPGDEVEVDRGGNEGLRLNLANNTNNIELTIGALFDGNQYNNGHQEILQWEAWNGGVLIASGQILGTDNGIVTVDIDTLIPFDHVILKPINNGQGDQDGESFGDNSDFLLINAEICCPEDKFTEKFDYTLRDADGDEACATLKVDVKDTAPTHEDPHSIITTLLVDEDGLPNGVGNTNSPADNEEDHNLPNAPQDDAKHIGVIPFTPGADPVSIELSVLFGPDTGMKTLANQKIFAAWDSATQTLIGYIEGTDPNDAPNQIFKMHITDAQTGAYEFELLQPVKHNNSDIVIDDNTENVANLPANFVVVAEIEDKDCDVIFSKVLVTIDDDMPVITKTENTISLNVDETLGGNGTDFDDPFNVGVKDGSTIENDEALASLPAALTAYGTVIGADEADGASLFGFNAGADGLQSAVYGLKITGGGSTGLIDTATGFSIKLVQNGNVIEGQADDGNKATKDAVVFAFTIDQGTGEVSMAQYRAINHGNEEGEFGAPDEVATMLSGKLAVTLAVTDKDGDTVSASKDISGSITFDDDGPIVTKGSGTLTLALDETVSKSDADYDDPNFTNDGVQDGNAIEGDENFVALPAVLTGLGTPIGAATGSSVGLFSVQPGSDGLASIKYFLQIGLGATGLTDTASQTPITLVPEGGVVKGKDGLGNLVFAISIDQNTGQVSVAQFRAVDHGDEETAPGAHDEVVFLGQNSLSVLAIATDKDGDSDSELVDISHGISFDDDGPSATCDYDSVTEGKGNTATGNVVSGANPENPDLGTDANGTDGNADQLSQDTPHTISKLTHGGHEYTLSADGLTVLKDGGALSVGESFAGGKLTITTAEGATFEIIMVSSDPADVGEYRYTAGDAPIHAEDVHVGPIDLAASRSGAFDSVTEWQNAFTTGGINLVANGGSLALKNIDVNPKAGFGGAEDYRGIGVDTGIDSAEVDTQSENLTLEFDAVKFPGGVNNAELLIGALFNGVQFDAGNQEILKWEAYDGAVLVASGQIVGDLDGLVTLDIDSPVNFNKIVLTPLNNGAGNSSGNNSDFLLVNVEVCEQEPVKEVFGYTLRDGDGDESSASLKICVEDTYPTVPQEGNLCLFVDEDGLPAGIGNSDSPNDAPATSASANGFIPFTPGADPVTIELSIGNGGDTGLKTLTGQTVLGAWDAASSTLIGYIAGTDPSDAANQVFKMTVTNHTTGAVTFDLLQPIKHADTDQGGNDTENYPDPTLIVNVQIEDKDCDVAFTTVHIKIDDDMPVIGQGSGAFALAVDESLDDDTKTNNAGDHPHNPGTRIEDDEDGAGLPGVLTGLGSVIGASKSGASGLFSFNPGADGLLSAAYSLTLLGGSAGPVATNLVDTQDNTLISLFTNPDGTVRGISAGGHLVFALTINGATGEVSMAQYRAINHGNEEAAPGNHDEVKSLGAPAASTAPVLTDLLSVKLTVTDKDNDTVSKTVDITGKITFDDDGPTACIDKKHDNEVTHDESAGLQNDDQAGKLPAVFPAGALGWAHSSDPIVTTSGSEYGTDGAGTTVLSLKIPADGTNSGLDDTVTGNDILLYQVGGIVEGKVAGSGELVFAVSINQDGTIDVAQYRAIEHPDTNDHDEDVGINQDALQAVITITDKDGDSDTASVGIGSRVRFDDDGPKADIDIKHDACIILDESKDAAAGDGYPDGNANDEAGNVKDDIAYGTILGKDLIVDSSSFGTDGPGTKTYSLVVSDGTNSGLFDSASNATIRLYQVNATTIEGRPDVSGTDPVSFRITIDPATGNVTVSQFLAVEHDNAGSSASDHDESGSPEIMDSGKLFVRQTITDGDKDHDTDDIDLGKIIKFEDDGPIARNDVDALDAAPGNTFESKGNVITGTGVTTPGIDDGGTDTPWNISNLVGSKSSDSSSGGGGFIVTGTYGQLTMQSDGSYTYDFDETNTGKVASGSTDVFTYTLRDSDGDTDPATLTINMGEATVETSAVVNNGAGGCIPEDTFGPLTLKADPGTGDRVTQIVLSNVPAGWDIKDDSNADFVVVGGTLVGSPVFAGGQITFNIAGAAPGVDVTVTVQVKGAPDSDVNGTGLVVGATVVDGVVFANDTTPFDVSIDAVADGDDKGDDGDADKLGVKIDVTDGIADVNTSFQVGETGNVNVKASFDDFKDGSETHTLTVQAPTGFTFDTGNVGVLPAGVVLDLPASDSDTLVFKVDSKDDVPNNGVGSLDLNIPVVYGGGVEGKVSGDFTATVTATETPTELECNYDNNTDSATATDTVPLASPPESNVSIGAEGNTEAICVPEDSDGVDVPVTATTTAGSHLTQIVISGFPAGGAGFTIDPTGLDLANTSIVQNIAAGTITITFLDAVTDSFSGSFKVTPPADSDLDLGTLTAVVNAVDNVDPGLTDDDSDQAFVRVDAIADGKDDANGGDGDSAVLSVSLTAADDPADLDGVFSAGEKGQLKLGATFDDFNDGSELHQITITAPAGFQFTGTISGLPAGVTVNSSNASTIVLDVDSTGGDGVGTIANVQIEIQNVSAPDSVTVDFTATASAVEQNTTATNGDGNDECTDANNSQSVSTTAAVTSQTDKLPIAYDDKVCGDEAAPRNVNVLLILDRSGSMNDEIPGSGGKTRLELLQEATAAMLNSLDENGDVRVMVVGFTTTASSNNQWVDVATAIALINALTPANLTNYEDALAVGANAFNQDTADRGDFADHDNLVFFMSDGVPTTGGTGDADGNHLTNANLQAWDNFLETPGNSIDQLTVVGIGADIAASDDDLEDVADPDYTPGDVDAKNPFGEVLIVADENGLKDALGGAVATAKIEGNVLDGSIENDDTSPNGVVDGDGTAPTPGDADFLGDTPTHIAQFKYDAAVDNLLDVTINYDGVGPVEIGDITGGENVSISGTKVSFDADYGRMTFDFSTGQFTYLAGSISGGDKEEHFNYTLKDTDGDVDSANLIVCIQDKYVDLQPIAYDNHDALTESSVAGAVTIVNNFDGGATGGTVYGGGSQAGSELVLTTSGGGGATSYASIRTSLIGEGLSGAALDALIGDLPDEGSAFVRPVSVAGPSVLRFEYDYNGNSDDNDTALYFVLNSSNQIVAQGVLGAGDPDVANGVVTVPLASAGNYKVIFTVNDREDSSGVTTLDIDRIETQPATVHTVSGNVITDANDTPSGSSDPIGAVDVLGDGVTRVNQVQFGSTIVDVPSDGSNVIVTGANGILTINSTGAYTYVSLPGTVPNGAVETDAFTYTLRDTDGDTDTAILRLDTTGINDPVAPTTNNVNASGNEDSTIVINLAGGDVDGTVTQFKVTGLPANGKLYADVGLSNEITLNETVAAIANAAQLFFVPTANYNGPASFQYAAIDNLGLADATPATASITVNSVDDPTSAVANHIYVGADSSVTIQAAWLLRDDSDADNTLSVTSVDETSSKFAINDGSLPTSFTVDYTDSEPSGSADAFTYTLSTGTIVSGGQVHLDDNDTTVSGGATNDIVVGTGSANVLNGNGGNDVVIGGAGADTLNGGDGDDFLDGGEDGDTYNGGKGTDTIDVGDGEDTVNYTSKLDGTDVIQNFDANGGTHDLFSLDALFDSLGTATASRAALVQITDNGTTVDIKVNADGAVGFELHVATLNTGDTVDLGTDVIVGTL